jgi:hypothetical protein
LTSAWIWEVPPSTPSTESVSIAALISSTSKTIHGRFNSGQAVRSHLVSRQRLGIDHDQMYFGSVLKVYG